MLNWWMPGCMFVNSEGYFPGSSDPSLFANARSPGPEVIKLEYSIKLKIKRNDWLLADTCPQAANHCALF